MCNPDGSTELNTHFSEQINGVQTLLRGVGGAAGTEVPMGGAGLANPAGFLNYRYAPQSDADESVPDLLGPRQSEFAGVSNGV